MRILFITDNFPPEVNAPATRTFEHAREWVEAGAKVTILTCHPNFPQGRVYDGYKNQLRKVEEIEGIRVVRLWSYMSRNEGFVKRTLDYLSFAFMSAIAGLFEKSDVIIATSPQFFTTWSGWLLSKLKRRPWMFELRDLWPESIATVGALNKDGKLYKFLEKIELALYRSANLVIPNTPAFKRNLISRSISTDKIYVVPNGANLELFNPKTSGDELKKELGLEGKKIVSYIGTHGLAHSLDFIINSIAKIKREDVQFVFIGDGAEKKRIKKLADELKLSNVTFIDPIPKNQIPKYLSITDVALVPLKKSETFKTVIPSKIFEAAAMGVPILLGVEGQAQKIIEQFDAGLCFEPENEEEFIDKVDHILSDSSEYSRLSTGGLQLAKAYDRKELAIDMLEKLEHVVNDVSLLKSKV